MWNKLSSIIEFHICMLFNMLNKINISNKISVGEHDKLIIVILLKELHIFGTSHLSECKLFLNSFFL